MEVIDPNEAPDLKTVNNRKALKLKCEQNGKDIEEKSPAYQQWLNKMKYEIGENGIVCYCINCRYFFYFESIRRKNLYHHENCNSSDLAQFCEYCGELYNKESICCFRRAIILIKRNFYDSFQGDCQDCCFVFPFLSTIYLFSVFFHLIISLRFFKYKNINSKNEFIVSDRIIITLFVPITIVYSLLFFLYYIYFYFFLLIFQLITRHQRIKDRNDGNFRY